MSTVSPKSAWLLEMGLFILEANQHTWAGDGRELTPQLDGFKKLEYCRETWELIDHYTGYFTAPGFTVVYFKGKPVWTQSYGGQGQHPRSYNLAPATFNSLKESLLRNADPIVPFRGSIGSSGNFFYYFHLDEGSIEDARWTEEIIYYPGNFSVFRQTGQAGIVIGKDFEGLPVYPWDL